MKRLLMLMLLLALPAMAQINTAATSLSAVTTTGAGTAFQINPASAHYTWTVTFKTAGPTSQTTNLEGSLDGVHYFTLDTSTSIAWTSDTVTGEMRHVVNKPVLWLRCNLAAVSIGSATGVTCVLIATTN